MESITHYSFLNDHYTDEELENIAQDYEIMQEMYDESEMRYLKPGFMDIDEMAEQQKKRA